MVAEFAPYVSLTPAGLLGLCVLLILFGYLVPVKIVRDRMADKDALIRQQADAIRDLRANNLQLLKANGITVQVLESTADAVGGESNAEVV
jgi:hypothetical protein